MPRDEDVISRRFSGFYSGSKITESTRKRLPRTFDFSEIFQQRQDEEGYFRVGTTRRGTRPRTWHCTHVCHTYGPSRRRTPQGVRQKTVLKFAQQVFRTAYWRAACDNVQRASNTVERNQTQPVVKIGFSAAFSSAATVVVVFLGGKKTKMYYDTRRNRARQY